MTNKSKVNNIISFNQYETISLTLLKLQVGAKINKRLMQKNRPQTFIMTLFDRTTNHCFNGLYMYVAGKKI